MKNKEIATALGLSVALAVSGCGATNEPVETAQVEETAPAEIEEAIETEEVIEADTTAPEISVKKDIKGVDFGATIKPEDYAEAKDENEVSLFFVTESGDESELEIPKDLDISVKEINFTVVAVDSEGNRSKEITVTIPIVHDFSAEILDKEEGKSKYELDEFTCNTCGTVYSESALDDVAGEDLYDTELDKYTIEEIEKKMVTTQACNVRTGPSIEFEKAGSLGANEEVDITGYCEEENWYRIKKDEDEVYVSGKFLQDKKAAQDKKVSKSSGENNGETNNANQGDYSDDYARHIAETLADQQARGAQCLAENIANGSQCLSVVCNCGETNFDEIPAEVW